MVSIDKDCTCWNLHPAALEVGTKAWLEKKEKLVKNMPKSNLQKIYQKEILDNLNQESSR